jgi:lysophospholipase L1-like esterase
MRRALMQVGVHALRTLLLLGALEGVARLATDAEPAPLFDDPGRFLRDRDFVVPHPVRGFALRPGFESGPYRIDSEGLRGPEGPAASGGARPILAVGDSTTFGWDVDESGTWPRQLEERLGGSGSPLRVVNAGVPSYTSAQTRLYLEELLPRLRPGWVLVSALWNDVWYSSLDPWYPEALVQGRPAPWRRWLYRHSALFRWLLGAPGPGGAEGAVDVVNRAALAHYAENVEGMARAGAEHGASVAFLMPPLDLARVDDSLGPLLSPIGRGYFTKGFVLEIGRLYAEAMAAAAARQGAGVIDHPLSILHPGRTELFLDFVHPDARGNRLIAEAVAGFLESERR